MKNNCSEFVTFKLYLLLDIILSGIPNYMYYFLKYVYTSKLWSSRPTNKAASAPRQNVKY